MQIVDGLLDCASTEPGRRRPAVQSQAPINDGRWRRSRSITMRMTHQLLMYLDGVRSPAGRLLSNVGWYAVAQMPVMLGAFGDGGGHWT